MSNSLSTGQLWARQMASFALSKDLSSREIEERTEHLIANCEAAELGAVIKLLLLELLTSR